MSLFKKPVKPVNITTATAFLKEGEIKSTIKKFRKSEKMITDETKAIQVEAQANLSGIEQMSDFLNQVDAKLEKLPKAIQEAEEADNSLSSDDNPFKKMEMPEDCPHGSKVCSENSFK